jgi:type II secretory pathway pseudopilin PulG
MKPGHSQGTAAFSLVEVTLAVAIIGFAFAAIIGLVPVGLNSFRATKNVSTASQISEQIFSDVQATAWVELTGTHLTQAGATQATPNTTLTAGTVPGTYTLRLPAPAGPLTAPTSASPYFTRYFNDQGAETTSLDPAAIYQVNARVLFGTPWVQSTAGATANADLATVQVQIAYVPGQQTPDLGSGTTANLWTGTVGRGAIAIQMFTFQTCVARNF